MRIADSSVKQFISGILSCAISRILIPRHLTDLVAVGLRGTFLHFSCFLELDSYGRLFYNKVERLVAVNRDDDRKNLSRLVLRTSIECLQKSMILTPLEPNAGPTGGEGLAAPPLICNLINAATSFAYSFPWLIILFLLV